MIRKIDYLRNFALYRDFQWGTLPPFAKYNLVYGWNYSGKTTLSRLFQLLEQPSRLSRWQGLSFRIELEGGSYVTNASLSQLPLLKTRVFNREFIQENFVQEHTAPAVFILGAENLVLRQRLEVLNARHERVAQIQAQFREQIRQVQSEIEQSGTDKARDVGNLLGDRNFRRPNLVQRVEEIRQNHTAALLGDDEVTAKLEIWRTNSEWRRLSVISTNLPDMSALFESVSELLGQTASNRAIERLKTDRNIENWVRMGLELHQHRHECEFCGSTITDTRLEQLRGHFSQEYEALVRALNTKIQECQNFRLDIPLPDERDFAPDLKMGFEELLERIQNWRGWAEHVRAIWLKSSPTRLHTLNRS